MASRRRLLTVAALVRLARTGTIQQTIENDSPSLVYSGSAWTTLSGTAYSGGSVTFASAPGTSVSYTSSIGVTQLSILTSFSPGSGAGQVLIDGRAPLPMDPTQRPYGAQKTGFTSGALDPSVAHTLTLSYDPLSQTGGHLDFDALLVARLDSAGLASLSAANSTTSAQPTSSTAMTPSSAPAVASGSSSVGAIAGGAAGGVFAMIIIGAAAWWLWRRAHARSERRRSNFSHYEIDRPLSPRAQPRPYEMSYAPVATSSTAAFAAPDHAYQSLSGPSQSGHSELPSLSSGHGHSPMPSPGQRPLSASEQSSGSTRLGYMQAGTASHSSPSEAYGPEWLAARAPSHPPVGLANPDPSSPVESVASLRRQDSSAVQSGFVAMPGSRKTGEIDSFASTEFEDTPPAYPGPFHPSGPSPRPA